MCLGYKVLPHIQCHRQWLQVLVSHTYKKIEQQSPPHPQRKSFSLYKGAVAFYLRTLPKAAASVL